MWVFDKLYHTHGYTFFTDHYRPCRCVQTALRPLCSKKTTKKVIFLSPSLCFLPVVQHSHFTHCHSAAVKYSKITCPELGSAIQHCKRTVTALQVHQHQIHSCSLWSSLQIPPLLQMMVSDKCHKSMAAAGEAKFQTISNQPFVKFKFNEALNNQRPWREVPQMCDQ